MRTTAALMMSSAAIQKAGEACAGTTWRGRRAMRVSGYNWQPFDEDVE